ncbi:MAG: hypothetical protein WDN69_37590 [Aliidongia sp.]
MSFATGDALPIFVVPSVSAAAMKEWAVFLRDPNPIHLDPEVVKAKGLGDKVINQGPANVAYVMNMLMAAFPRRGAGADEFPLRRQCLCRRPPHRRRYGDRKRRRPDTLRGLAAGRRPSGHRRHGGDPGKTYALIDSLSWCRKGTRRCQADHLLMCACW